MRWVDAHCHLEKDDFPDATPLLDRARQAGLVHAVVVGQFQKDGTFGSTLEVRDANPQFLTATMGIHPHEAARVTDPVFAELERLCALPSVAAVGEAGLDYYYDSSPRDAQQQLFARQCELAKKVRKPLVIHVRDAHEDCDRILGEHGMQGGVIHCFTGDTTAARRYLDRGFVLSIAGVVTYKKTEALQDAVKFAPMDRLLVETDTPYLAPVPYRGKRNEPSYVVETGKKIAELKGVPVEEVAEATSRNTARVFGFPL